MTPIFSPCTLGRQRLLSVVILYELTFNVLRLPSGGRVIRRLGYLGENFLATPGAGVGRYGLLAVLAIEQLAEIVVTGAAGVQHRGDYLRQMSVCAEVRFLTSRDRRSGRFVRPVRLAFLHGSYGVQLLAEAHHDILQRSPVGDVCSPYWLVLQ